MAEKLPAADSAAGVTSEETVVSRNVLVRSDAERIETVADAIRYIEAPRRPYVNFGFAVGRRTLGFQGASLIWTL